MTMVAGGGISVSKIKRGTLQFVIALSMAVPGAQLRASETLVKWVPDQSGATIYDTDPVPGSTAISNLTFSSLTQVGAVGFNNAYVWPVSVDAPRDDARYLQFEVTPGAGRVISLRSLYYAGLSYNASHLQLHLRTAFDAYAADIASADSASDTFRSPRLAFDLGGLPAEIDSAITFRLYPDQVSGTDDFLDLRGDDGIGLSLVGEFAARLDFGDSEFYSFSNELVGGFEIADAERNIRFVALGEGIMRLQNQISGDARVRCLDGQKDFFASSLFDSASVTEQFPACLDLDQSDLPSDVSIWKLPDGRLFRFQMLQFTSTPVGPPDPVQMYEVSGRFQAGPLQAIRVFADGFEG